MNINKKISRNKRKLYFLWVFFTLIFVTACGDNEHKSEASGHSSMPQSLLSSPTNIKVQNPNEVKTWHGEDFGFVASDKPIRNRVDALIALGQIDAAVRSYRNTSLFLSNNANAEEIKKWRKHAAASINNETIEIYNSLDIIFKQNNIKPFKDIIEELAKPETIDDYTRASKISNEGHDGKRQLKNQITQSTRVVSASVLNAVSVLAPSRKEYLLAGSRMLRESGKSLKLGLSVKGEITDSSKHQFGVSQIDSALNLIPKFAIHMCEEQREISQTYRKNTNQLVENLMSFDNQPTKANVDDVYALATQIEAIAKNLPDRDRDICN